MTAVPVVLEVQPLPWHRMLAGAYKKQASQWRGRTVCLSCGDLARLAVLTSAPLLQGMKDKAKITLRGEAGRSDPDVLPGDVVFVLDCKPHKQFHRVNQDLTFQKQISLREALCGLEFTIPHLDGRVLRVRPAPTCAGSAGFGWRAGFWEDLSIFCRSMPHKLENALATPCI